MVPVSSSWALHQRPHMLHKKEKEKILSTKYWFYFQVSFNICHILYFIPSLLPVTAQRDRAPAVMMASVCGVLRQPGGGGKLLLLHLAFLGWVSGTSLVLLCGFPVRKLAVSNVCCWLGCAWWGNFRCVILRGKTSVCEASQQGLITQDKLFVGDLPWLLSSVSWILLLLAGNALQQSRD